MTDSTSPQPMSMPQQSAEGAGVPHPPGTPTKPMTVEHPNGGESSTILVPANHRGERIKVEFPDGTTAFTEGWDPAEEALSAARPVVPCGNCGAPQVLTGSSRFTCSACGVENVIELRAAAEWATAEDGQTKVSS